LATRNVTTSDIQATVVNPWVAERHGELVIPGAKRESAFEVADILTTSAAHRLGGFPSVPEEIRSQQREATTMLSVSNVWRHGAKVLFDEAHRVYAGEAVRLPAPTERQVDVQRS
jgi:hypothetical protein